MNEGLDEGAAERIQKEQVFLIKPSLSSLATIYKVSSLRTKEGRTGASNGTRPCLVEARHSDRRRDGEPGRHYTCLCGL